MNIDLIQNDSYENSKLKGFLIVAAFAAVTLTSCKDRESETTTETMSTDTYSTETDATGTNMDTAMPTDTTGMGTDGGTDGTGSAGGTTGSGSTGTTDAGTQ